MLCICMTMWLVHTWDHGVLWMPYWLAALQPEVISFRVQPLFLFLISHFSPLILGSAAQTANRPYHRGPSTEKWRNRRSHSWETNNKSKHRVVPDDASTFLSWLNPESSLSSLGISRCFCIRSLCQVSHLCFAASKCDSKQLVRSFISSLCWFAFFYAVPNTHCLANVILKLLYKRRVAKLRDFPFLMEWDRLLQEFADYGSTSQVLGNDKGFKRRLGMRFIPIENGSLRRKMKDVLRFIK